MSVHRPFSSYRNHYTVKILIGITPQGSISFVSKAWGARISDKFLAENFRILKNILRGDLVLADRGFTMRKSYVPPGPTTYSSIQKRERPAGPSKC